MKGGDNMAKCMKYGVLPISKEVIPHDEPVFLFRAQDKLAEPLLRLYADMVRLYSGDTEQYRKVILQADNFARWSKKKMPD